jgi:membrane protein DedA with SNARE-associated domain/rhodanese-related sulfurtransferase
MQSIVSLIEQYGLIAVFVSVLADEAGLPVPSYPLLMAAAALAPVSASALSGIVLVGAAAALLADLAWFWSGRLYGRRVLKLLCRISLSPDSCVRDTEAMALRLGPLSLTLSKFVPGFSNIAPALAGSARSKLAGFVLFDGIGALVYVGLAVLLGAVFRDAVEDVLSVLVQWGKWGVLFLAGALGLFLSVKWWQRRRFMRQLRMDRISVDELEALIRDGGCPIILDVRPQAVRLREGTIPGSVGASTSELESVRQAFPRDAEIVVYCSCPNEASAAHAARHLKQAGFKKIRPLLGGIEAWALAGHPVEQVARAREVAKGVLV